jgi:putative ABC transport system substrate-binding protein
MMARSPIRLIVVLALGLCITPCFTVAQQTLTSATIGVLTFGTLASPELSPQADAFRQELRTRGWVEGQNLIIEYRQAEGQAERLPALAAELVRLRVDVIVAFSAPAIRAAKQATTTIPIVFETLADAVVMGFVSNLARPGGNITGVTGFAPELGGKWLDLLRQVVPGVRHVALLSNPANPNTPSIVQEMESAVQASGVDLHVVEVRGPSGLEDAFVALRDRQAAALIIPPDPFFVRQTRRIAELATAARLPTISGMQPIVEAGGLISYGTTLVDNWRRAAVYVDRILRGATPGDLPVERPTTFELLINLQTAKTLGLTIPPTLLFQADKVIQ